ncbi:MAG: putative transposase [Rhodospirillaceae bacterium]|nr:MAG: putative transposase [Rhodospirillaceae bacterium]
MRYVTSVERIGFANGFAQGVQQDRTEGEAKGKAEMLLEMVRLRFGPLSPEGISRLRAADAAQLRKWSRRFINARTLADVFGTRPH